MPVQRCTENGKSGYKWGEEGKCYTYAAGNAASEKQAKKRALAQGVAMGEFDKEAFGNVGE